MLRTLPRWVCQVTYRGVIHRPRANTRRLGRFFVHSRLVGVGHVSGDLRGSLLGAIGLAVVVAVGGCSGSTSPQTLPSVSGSPAPSGSSSPAETSASAVAFVRLVYSELNTALKTGDTSQLVRDVSPACTCYQVISYVQRVYRQNHLVGGGYTILKVEDTAISGRSASVLIQYRLSAVRVLDSTGRTLQVQPGSGPTTVALVLTWNSGRWIVSATHTFPAS